MNKNYLFLLAFSTCLIATPAKSQVLQISTQEENNIKNFVCESLYSNTYSVSQLMPMVKDHILYLTRFTRQSEINYYPPESFVKTMVQSTENQLASVRAFDLIKEAVNNDC